MDQTNIVRSSRYLIWRHIWRDCYTQATVFVAISPGIIWGVSKSKAAKRLDGYIDAALCKVFEGRMENKRAMYILTQLLYASVTAYCWRKCLQFFAGSRKYNIMSPTKKTIFISGATRGLGFTIASEAAKKGDNLILGCRNETKAILMKQSIQKFYPDTVVSYVIYDLSDLSTIVEAIKVIRQSNWNIDVFILNAGERDAKWRLTKQEYEHQFGSYVLGHFCFINSLFEDLKSWNTRVIGITSMEHYKASLAWEDYDNKRIIKALTKTDPFLYDSTMVYGRCQFCILMLMAELQKRFDLSQTTATAYSCHPGFLPKDIYHLEGLKWCGNWMLNQLCTDKGSAASTVLFLANQNKSLLTSGGYYYMCKPLDPIKEVGNIQLCEHIWHRCCELTAKYYYPKEPTRFPNINIEVTEHHVVNQTVTHTRVSESHSATQTNVLRSNMLSTT